MLDDYPTLHSGHVQTNPGRPRLALGIRCERRSLYIKEREEIRLQTITFDLYSLASAELQICYVTVRYR